VTNHVASKHLERRSRTTATLLPSTGAISTWTT